MATSDSAPAADPAATDTGTDDVNADDTGTGEGGDEQPKPKAQPTAADELANQLATAKQEAKDAKAEADRLLRESRKHEARAKTNAEAARQLEEIRTKDLPEHERAIEVARKAGRAEALGEFGQRIAAAEFRAAAAGRMDPAKLDVLIGGLNLARFVDDDGNAIREDIETYVGSILPEAPPPPAPDAKTDDEQPAQPEFDDEPAPRRSGQQPGDIGQGAGRGAPPEALNGDGLTHAIERAVGIRR